MPCFCTKQPPLCIFCVDVAMTRRLVRAAEGIGKGWGRSVYRRRRGGTWPSWDEDTSGKLRAAARWYVRALHDDPQVLDRLARICARAAGLEYKSPTRPRGIAHP